MKESPEILKCFDPISLADMNKVKLLDRLDKKYMFHVSKFPDILAHAMSDYYALVIDGKNYAAYETTYFDTPDYQMYTMHHNGKLNRYKVRFRTYVDSNLNFFEIKFKTNKGRTIKSRIMLPEKDLSLTGDVKKLLEKKTAYKAEDLVPAMQVNYNRITLVNKKMTERITLDFNLDYMSHGKKVEIPELVIAEIKQDRSDKSPFVTIMQEKRILPVSLSKYCLGIASIVENVKLNNFKPKVRYVNQLFCKSA
ncbi:MAG: polyphosphate polymerase domain-containing protein [Paludibacter sp.]|nr:polyphosphate polymerase domain-containing protein [Paludibacter sp.]